MLLYRVPFSPPTPDKPGISLSPPDSPDRTSVNVVLRVKNCESAYKELSSNGVEFLTVPQKPLWGGLRAFARDPDGYLIEVEEEPDKGDDSPPLF